MRFSGEIAILGARAASEALSKATLSLLALVALGCASPKGAAPEVTPLPEDDPRIRSLLHGADVGEQTRAMKELAAIGPAAVPPLARLLQSPAVSDAQGAWIAETLGDMGPAAEPAARALTARLARGGDCAPTTSWALGTMGAKGVPWLIEALTAGKPKGRMWAAHELRQSGSTENGAVAALVTALEHDDAPEVRTEAAWTLACMRPVTPAAEAALRKALGDESETVRDAVREALERLASDGR